MQPVRLGNGAIAISLAIYNSVAPLPMISKSYRVNKPYCDQGWSTGAIVEENCMPAENGLQSWMMICGIGLLVWLFIRGKLVRKNQQRELAPVLKQFKHNGNAQLSPVVFEGKQSLGAPAEVLKWQVELHDLARELKGELDSRLVAVRTVSQAFDQAAKRMSELVSATQSNQIGEDTPAAQMLRLARAGFDAQHIATQFGVDVSFVRILVGSADEALSQ